MLGQVIGRLWDCIQGDPVFMRRLNGWLTLFWIAMIPVSYVAGWLHSVTYVSALSLWALVAGHWSTWQSGRVEVAQNEQDVGREVVEAVVEHTNIEPTEPGAPGTTI